MIGFHETTLEQLSVDHQVEVNALTGTASLTVPVRTSPGRGSFGPALKLVYASGESNSPFGVGWHLGGVASIGIDTSRQLATYREDEDRFAYNGDQELVPYRRQQGGEWRPVVDDRGDYRVHRYRSRVERTFERIEKWVHRDTGRVHWMVTARNGVVSVFGKADDGSTRIADPADPDHRTFIWLLEAQYHPKGDAIVYQYKAEDTAGVDPTLSYETRQVRSGAGMAQRYLKRILYGNSRPLSHQAPEDPQNRWNLEVVFDYGEHGSGPIPSHTETQDWPVRQDPVSGYRAGFELRTYRLCRRILMFHHFPELGAAPALVGATELAHRQDPAGSVLESIGYRGYRKDLQSGVVEDRAVPPLQMAYSQAQPAPSFEAPELADNVPAGVDGAAYQWIDLKEEGLPGILWARGDGWFFKENLGEGRFGPLEQVDQIPAAVSVASQLDDFDGDGNLNLVGLEGREAGYYERDRQKGQWEPYRTLTRLPRVDFRNAGVQLLDFNGDGHADLLVDRHDRLVWYPSEGAEGFAAPIEIAKPETSRGGAPTLTSNGQLQTFFADMTSDGLPDMVRVENGRVEYWPNLGHGHFGSGVLMEDAPLIDGFGQLDTRRLRFVDLDGSGTADLLYIGEGEIRYWINQSGNRWSAEQRLTNLPYIDRLSSVQAFDFLGDATRCLVWSSPLPTREGQAVQYLRLTGDLPPRFLVSVSNGIGREARLTYRSSAQDYLRDKNRGLPWRSRLPRHAMVVAQIEGIDQVGGSRMVTRYEYRDGTFDDDERRFRGFGRVDAYDADQIQAGDGAFPEEVTPPSLVRSYYHTGVPDGFFERAADFYTSDPLQARLPEPAFEELNGLTTEEQLDGYRALAGATWRQEFYTERADGTLSPHPLRVTEFAYRMGRLQPQIDERDVVFGLTQSEVLSHEYEEDPSDPRVNHTLVLESDPYGNVEQRVTLAYPRRPGGAGVRPEQQVLHAELTVMTHANLDTQSRFEVGIEIEVQRYELTGLAPLDPGAFRHGDLRGQAQAALANSIAFHETPAGGVPVARLLSWRRNLFWDDAGRAPLPPGQVGAVTLLHHVERAVLPELAVASAYDGRVDDQMLANDGHYTRQDGHWWAEDFTYGYRGPDAFFRLEQETTPSGARQSHSFDPHFMLVIAVEDIFGNRIEGTPDYQVLASSQVKDANDNLSEVLYDPLGVSIVNALRGEQLGSDGAAHPVGAESLANYLPQAGATATAVLADPAAFVQDASRFFFYDLEAFGRGDGPPLTINLERESHVHDGEGGPAAAGRVRVTVTYLDGFARPIQTKVRADPGPAIQRDASGEVIVSADGTPVLGPSDERWLTSGHDVYNNKGWLVRKFEPFFSTQPGFESDAALRRYGVATRTHYDPVGRVVQEDLPNGTITASAYTAWETRQSDANDTVIGSAYEAARAALASSDPERQALEKARAHARTPTIVEKDPLGRAYRVREVDENGVERVSTTHFGALGLPERIVDPRNLTAFAHGYDMLGRLLFEDSMDAGERRLLLDEAGRTAHRWDGRGVHTHHRYDENGRLVDTRVDGALGLNHLVQRLVYGDNPAGPQATIRNVRGRIAQRFDEAGVVAVERYHMDGQPIATRRTLREDFATTVDWTDPAAVSLSGDEHRTRAVLDGLGRIVTQSLADGTRREYSYAAEGHVSSVRVSTADGQLDRRVIASGIETNARGQRTRLRLGNGVEASYEYDDETFRLGRLVTRRVAGAPRDYMDIEYTYDPVGNVTRWVDRVQDPGAATPLIQGLTASSACEFTYDAFYQLKEARGRVHQALLQHDYRSGLTDQNALKGTRHISLNNGAAIERYTRSYDYDLGGNLKFIHHQGVTQTWTTEIWTSPSSNRSLPAQDLNGIDVANPESHFDENGNTILMPHLREMVWDHANRLTRAKVIDRSGTGQPDDAEYYVYGGDGLRVRRVSERLVNAQAVSGQVERIDTVYLEGCEIRRLSLGGTTRLLRTTSHITDGSARLATLHQWTVDASGRETDDVAEKRLHYLVGNHLGSVSLELDDDGEVISYEEYFPFGGTSFIAGRSARDVRLKEYRYSGKLRDDVTGFYGYEYRYYAPWIGNWLSPDPLGPEDGLNLYRFVHNNPIRFVDADGLQSDRYVEREFNRSTDVREGATDEELRKHVFKNDPVSRQWLAENIISPPVFAAEGFVWETIGWKWDPELGPNGANVRYVRKIKVADPNATGSQEDGLSIDPSDLDSGEEPGPSEENAELGSEQKDGDEAGNQAVEGDDEKGIVANSGDGNTGKEKTQSRKTEESEDRGDGVTNRKQGVDGSSGKATRPDGDKQPGRRVVVGPQPAQSSDGDTRNGATDVQPVPPDAPIGSDGAQLLPNTELPEVMPEAGIPLTDPSQVRQGAAISDPRGVPGAQGGGGMRPGGTQGDAPGEASGGSPQGTPEDSGEGGEPGGGLGLSGGKGWFSLSAFLPPWLAIPLALLGGGLDKALDFLQTALDVVGLIPGIGELADGLNGLISLARGDYVGAALSFAAMVPFAGWGATAGKWGKRAVGAADEVADVTSVVLHYGDEAASVVQSAAKNTDEAFSVVQSGAENIDEAFSVVQLGAKNTDEAFSVVQSGAENIDEAVQFASKNADELGHAPKERARFEVTPSGVAIPTDPAELRSNLSRLEDVSTNPSSSRKFTGVDSQGPVRVRVEKAHPADPNFTGTPDPLHTVDHLHIDRRKNIETGPWKSAEKVPYDWPF